MRCAPLPLVVLLLFALSRGDAAALCRYDCRDGEACSAACSDDAAAALQAAQLPPGGACAAEGEFARRCALAAPTCEACPPAPAADARTRRSQLAAEAASNLTHRYRPERHVTTGRRYDTVRVWLLSATWDAQRTVNAHAVCAALRPGHCRVVSGIHAAELNETALLALEAEGIVTRAPLPPRPLWYRRVPDALMPLLPEYATNQMAASHRTGAITAIAAGSARILRQMAAAAAAAGPAAAARTLYVYLEDDADLGAEPALFEARLLELGDMLPWRWDVLSLTPVPRVCSRSAMLPWYSARSALVRPRLAFTRTTALAHSARGLQRLVAAMPVTNAVDLWYRQLMRQAKLVILLHCGGLVRIGTQSDKQAH